jgi:ATP-dependent DNA helicase DinG
VPSTEVSELLAAAVAELSGTERPGQQAMADAVAAAMSGGGHLLVQAGTGTGKSLAYLVPAAVHALSDATGPVVVATATLALQSQLVTRDLPTLAPVAEQVLGRPVTWAVAKGRSNYACLHRVREGVPDDDGALIAADAVDGGTTGVLGREVLRAREWAEDEADSGGAGDRERLQPGVSDRVWGQVSVSARECLGASRCAYGDVCFAERARAVAEHADVVVTNHALLAIQAIDGIPVLPEHDAVVIDEGHELAARVTGSATQDLSAGQVQRLASRVSRLVDDDVAERLEDAAALLEGALDEARPGRMDEVPATVVEACVAVRDAARRVLSGLARPTGESPDESVVATAKARAEDVLSTAERLSGSRDNDVVWLEDRERGGRLLRVAPLSVAGLIRSRIFDTRCVVLTSATLTLGGSFDAVARGLGLVGEDAPEWTGLDVGSPFDYPRQAILYVARHLPRPGRDGLSPQVLDEITALVQAAGGRTLGLFSSRRAAETAAAHVRERQPDLTVLCQGDDLVPTLVAAFRDDPAVSLFGTLSLWQGVDVPGDTCTLVILDRIPFPRPDDPLMSARQRAVDASGGNGFMTVAATHAALLMAQGGGRLIRSLTDKGVLAVLDSRLATARYGGFIRASLPPMWPTADPELVRSALRRLAGDG